MASIQPSGTPPRSIFESLAANPKQVQMGLFALLCTATMGVAVYQAYIKQLLQLRWRKWLNAKLVDQWLAGGLHYQLTFIETGIDNPDQIHQILDALNQVSGAFSITLLTDDAMIAARDPHGWRPLAVGKLGPSFVVASETCAFDLIEAYPRTSAMSAMKA